MKIEIEKIEQSFLDQVALDGFSVQAILKTLDESGSFHKKINQFKRLTNDRYSTKVIRRAFNGKKEQIAEKEVRDCVDWFRSKRRRKFVLEVDAGQNNEKLFTNDLEEFSQGKPTDFIVWNCIGFDWEQNPLNGYPPCRLNDNLDVSIVDYFLPRLREAAEHLSSIGNPTIIPMVPSTEATYESMWTYKQSREEREGIVLSAVNGLKRKLEPSQFPDNVTVEPMRWDEYLKTRNIAKNPLEYAVEGEQRLKEAPDFWRIQAEAIQNGVEYFNQNGIKVDTTLIAEKRIRYYGMYEGEGAAMTDIRESGRNVIVINLEEFRVSKMALRGAKGKLPIVTPISEEEMTLYYQWENKMKKQRP